MIAITVRTRFVAAVMDSPIPVAYVYIAVLFWNSEKQMLSD